MTPPTTSYKFGDVVLVPFPFTDQTASKQRPDVILMPVTSQPGPAGIVGEVAVTEWRQAGLINASVIKPIVATLEWTLIRRSLGELQPADQAALRAALQVIVG